MLLLCFVAVFSVAIFSTGEAQKTCPVDFEYVPAINQCLYLNRNQLPWDNARLACASFKTGAQLASIKDSTKQAEVRRYLENQFAKPDTEVCIWPWTGVAKIAWIDGQTKNPNQCNSPFFWKPLRATETQFFYANWYPGMPNCNGGDENCAIIAAGSDYDYRWEDVRCDLGRCSLCEF